MHFQAYGALLGKELILAIFDSRLTTVYLNKQAVCRGIEGKYYKRYENIEASFTCL